jgi:hypothetical protein
MAPKAKREPTAEEWYCEAVDRRIAVHGSPEEAQDALIAELKAGLPYSYVDENGVRVPGKAAFWHSIWLAVERDKNRAFQGANPIAPVFATSEAPPEAPSDFPEKIRGIKVAIRADASALTENARWIAGEAKRMRQASKVSEQGRMTKAESELRKAFLKPDIKISHFAQLLAKRMAEAAKADTSIRPLKWTYIKNMLRDWGCWPISQRSSSTTHLNCASHVHRAVIRISCPFPRRI